MALFDYSSATWVACCYVPCVPVDKSTVAGVYVTSNAGWESGLWWGYFE